MSSFREGLLKWNLMLTTAPLVTVVLLARFLLNVFMSQTAAIFLESWTSAPLRRS